MRLLHAIDSLRMFSSTFSSILGAIILISIVLPWFLIAVVCISVLYVYAAMFYRASARELKVCLDIALPYEVAHSKFSQRLGILFLTLQCNRLLNGLLQMPFCDQVYTLIFPNHCPVWPQSEHMENRNASVQTIWNVWMWKIGWRLYFCFEDTC